MWVISAKSSFASVTDRDAVQKASAGLTRTAEVSICRRWDWWIWIGRSRLLSSRGATHVASCSSGHAVSPDEETLAAIVKWNAAGIASSVHARDVADDASLWHSAENGAAPFWSDQGIVHAAVLDDAYFHSIVSAPGGRGEGKWRE